MVVNLENRITCKIPDDCWGCAEYDECKRIESWKETHRLPIIPVIGMAAVIFLIAFGVIYGAVKCIKMALTQLPF